MDRKTILVWFRNDLRVHDNEILLRATERAHQVVPVYCFDPRYFTTTRYGTKKTGVLRAEFIRQNVRALQQALQRLGGNLIIAHGLPEVVLPQIAEQHQVDEVYHHREVAYEETQISALVEEALWKMQINLRHFIGHTLYHKEDLPFPIKDIPDAFGIFRKKTERESDIRPQLGVPEIIRVPENIDIGRLPDLEELGFDKAEIAQTHHVPFKGGEEEALRQMDTYLSAHSAGVDFSNLSPYIAIGALSPNTLYHAAKKAEKTVSDKKRVEQLILKLLWRDYYRFMFKKHGNRFFKVKGLTDTLPDMNEEDGDLFHRWKSGDTGNPIVDKGIRQLNDTGHIPHHLRMIVAAYLIHELKVNWLKGAAWFEEKLIDYGPANNYGNWAHLAGVGSSQKENKPIDIKKLSSRFYPKEAYVSG